jgi:Uma2 family endonuclease
MLPPDDAKIAAMDRPDEMLTARAEPVRLTYDDFVRFPDDGQRHELIDGEHIVTPAPVARHQRISGRLFLALGSHVQASRSGEMFYAPFDVILSNYDVVEPDLLFVSNERKELVREWVYGAPDLVIEILSPSSRRTDQTKKLAVYDRFGVREFWLVDPDANVVTVYRRVGDGSFPRVADLAAGRGDAIETPLLPGLAVDLDALFA